MYERNSEGWFKHADFILLDIICLQLAFWLSYLFRGVGVNPYASVLYRSVAAFITVGDMGVMFFFDTMRSVIKRGHYREFVVTLEHDLIVCGLTVVYLFVIHDAQSYSRLALGMMAVLYFALSYVSRELWKSLLAKKREGEGKRSLLIVTNEKIAAKVIHSIENNNYGMHHIAGLVIMDRDMKGERIADVDVVANTDDAAMYVCQEWIDEVLVIPAVQSAYPSELLDQLTETGVTIHLNLAKVTNVEGKRQFVEKIGDYTVLTTSINNATARALFFKRLMDIAGGLVGCLITAILCIIIGPIIYISSPGPIFFSQERVGKNGKKFKMYKFRSMYMDAEERKAELMAQNKMGDNKMFKMDFDPRVIGNKILPDGRKKTGIGNFIRSTSLDEFPQFFNVLKGDMSIVGTRPPLIGEVSEYEIHHRARLAIKPGITGMWQVSGRSDILDFEEVVRLDKEYISRWTLGLDIKILFKTVMVVFKKEGSV